ncbi:glycosyltransferase family 2 protein [Sinomicrobium kalidii]|uniref:glycosyltransferase family 2 protein n=1 Tax=Sinomicrobium kalidii TaxID=2900738 RepID=UPI001E482B0E|nr:glycosyltransferase family A protein [Sinomicrobium kalidii]UGU14373.1 glycosyltransferase family 2 protein [Sinomicrobium kalidii]
MNYEPLVSVIIPTHNRVRLLQQTLKSILEQTYRNFEIIIISDASTDNTSTVVTSYNDERIKFVELKNNLKYPSRVRNIGIEKAKGEFIAFCDDDDLWIKNKLEIQVAYLLANDNIELVASNSYSFPGHIVPSSQLWRNKRLTYGELLKVNSIRTSSVIIRKRILDRIGKFDEDEVLHIGEDWDLWMRVLQCKDNSIVILKECLVFYRIGNVKITNSHYEPKKNIRAKLHIYEKHKPFSKVEIQQLLNQIEVETETKSKKRLIHEITREFYSKEISSHDFFALENLTFKEKLIILIKLYVRYIYSILGQKKLFFNTRNIN